MFPLLSQQTSVFINSIFWGIMISFFYDVLRSIRYELHAGKVITVIFDILFCIGVCTWYFIFAITTAIGNVRGFIFFGIFLGSCFYYLAINPLIFYLLKRILKFVVKNVYRFFEKIYIIFKKILLILGKIV